MNVPKTINITSDEVKKVAHLARLKMSEADIQKHTASLSTILKMISHIQEQDTNQVAPMFSALDVTLETRPDTISETNQRDLFQSLAPQTESGLYLVPQVIE